MPPNIKKIFLLFTLSLYVSPLWAVNKDDFLSFCESRDNSIKSYSVEIHKGHLDINLEDYDAFVDSIAQLEHMQIDNVNPMQLVDNIAGKWNKKIGWVNKKMIQKEERFKEITSFSEGGRYDVRLYDGQIYRVYQKKDGQLDLHPEIPPIVHLDFDYLGITSKQLRNRGDVISYSETGEGCEISFPITKDNSRIINQKYDSDLNIRKSCFFRNGKLGRDSRWLFYRQVEGYSIPRLNIVFNLYKDRCSIFCYIIENVEINCQLTDEDFVIGEMPPWTLVVDRRQKPYTVKQLMQYPHEILRDEIMLGELTKPVADITQTAEGELLLDSEAQSNDTEQTEKTPLVTESEEAVQADSQTDQEDPKIVGSQTGSKWPVILVLLAVFTAVGLGVVIRRQRR